jgi:hypothetical protein
MVVGTSLARNHWLFNAEETVAASSARRTAETRGG